jgi:hypothetical protein
MKTLKQIREEANHLLEMEMLTHKKKIAATGAKLKAVQQKHTDAVKKHFDLADKAVQSLEKTHKNLSHAERSEQDSVRAHVIRARYHKDAAKADVHDHRHAPTYGNNNWQKKHISSKDVKHSERLHKELASAHAAHDAAKKNSPAGKLKSLGNKIKSKLTSEQNELDELSNKTLDSYAKKSYRQYAMSRKRQHDDENYTDKKRAMHKDRARKRHKGIGSVYKRDDARQNKDGSHAARYLHKPSAGERISTGKGGMYGGDTLRNKPSSALPKTYRDPNRK